MLQQDTKILEYWRKKYFKQAFIVLVLMFGVAWLGVCFCDYLWGEMFFILASVIVAYLMIKELREDLQTRGEALVLVHKKTLFDNLSFDYGRGIDENLLLNQEIAGAYRVRECYNVMTNEMFEIEEDCFYTNISSKFFSFKQTAFEGVILAVKTSQVSENLKGSVMISEGKIVSLGAMSAVLKNKGADIAVAELLKLLKASKADVIAVNGKLYFWVRTRVRIFHQFSLFRINFLSVFVKRIEQINQLAQKIAHAVNG